MKSFTPIKQKSEESDLGTVSKPSPKKVNLSPESMKLAGLLQEQIDGEDDDSVDEDTGGYFLQVLFPEGILESPAKYTVVCIVFIERSKKGYSMEDRIIWYLHNSPTFRTIDDSSKRFDKMKVDKFLKASMNSINQKITRNEPFGENKPKISGDYKVKHCFAIVKIGGQDVEGKLARINSFAEALCVLVQMKKGSSGDEKSLFWEVYDKFASEKIVKKLKQKERKVIFELKPEVKTFESLDKYFLDDDIIGLLGFMFDIKIVEEICSNKDVVKFGWRNKK